MTLVDFPPRSRFLRSPFSSVLQAILRGVNASQARRSKKATLQSLLFAPEWLLRDVGITREELVQAMQIRRK
jgi:hypothetical protein